MNNLTQSQISDLINQINSGKISNLSTYIMQNNWTLWEFKLKRSEKKESIYDQKGNQKTPIANVAVFTNTISENDITYIYEFKIHEEDKPFRGNNVFEADKNWTCQLTRRKVFTQDQAQELLNEIYTQLEIFKETFSSMDNSIFRTHNSFQILKNLYQALLPCKTNPHHKPFYDTFLGCNFSLKDLIINPSPNIPNAMKDFKVQKSSLIIDNNKKMQILSDLNSSDSNTLSRLIPHFKKLINLLEEIYPQYLEQNNDDNYGWSINRFSNETHHVVKSENFTTLPGDYYEHPHLELIYLSSRKEFTNELAHLIINCCLKNITDDPVSIYTDLKDNTYSTSVLTSSQDMKNLAQIYQFEPDLVALHLLHSHLNISLESPGNYFEELLEKLNEIDFNSPFYNYAQDYLKRIKAMTTPFSHNEQDSLDKPKQLDSMFQFIKNYGKNISSPNSVVQHENRQNDEERE